MKNKLSERQKDFSLLILMSLISGIVAYLTYFSFSVEFPGRLQKPFIYLWYMILAVIVVVSYFESRDQDEFITGKTQKMGVMNSFTTGAALLFVMVDGLKAWLVWSFVFIVMMFTARELGRVSRRKKEQAYLNQVGILLTDLHNSGEAAVNGQSVRVWSEKDIPKNSKVRIVELKGPYLYVEPL